MSDVILNVFFDESGKRSDKPNLMGGLSIPGGLYNNDEFNQLTADLRSGALKLHFTAYTGYAKLKADIIRAINVLSFYHHMIKFYVINYDYSMVANHTQFGTDLTEKTIYTKFPERIIYGLLRRYGKNSFVKAYIDIEDAQEYRNFNLDKLIKEQLNVQSLYRGEQYVVMNSRLVPKGQEIGVELTDQLLGIVRTIILNKPDGNKGVTAKNHLVVELLKNPNFYTFMENVRLFEWSKTKELAEVNLNDYLQLFIARHHKLFSANLEKPILTKNRRVSSIK